MKNLYRSGTSGLVLPVPNKQSFPPEYRDKPRLTYYASLFNSIEINSSFYKVPKGTTVKKWTTEVPRDFVFTYKLWQEITHVKGLAFNPKDVLNFMSVINEAGDQKGCLLLQFPPSLTIDGFSQVESLLSMISGWKVALEFRHSSWYISETFELADEYGASIVLHDIPKSRNTRLNKNAEFVYLRFHGPAGDYKGGYTLPQLEQNAVQIKAWMQEGKEVFVYFNNTIGDAIKNLMDLNALIS
ncbi:DUF72 domain-containing protein [Chitinophaga sancti]|uniref:DUF72 domain-containing protein n=1 Tax=Chitinophaga sancti TaxID=1004 RepID=A0A1K1SWR0_9BACT|nr:DUF72 domain-containing protein [Chitinophaga sancti]WQD63141.1 DUF72 domain-containing protein [Chitinophaga sancti]WQG91234.1 DUF72 domain-containing protein [Chitinophaga sancti]SFW88785.1 Uncharacterized conserved protein YecE, DUF72 family [Chitinophaga sancti]